MKSHFLALAAALALTTPAAAVVIDFDDLAAGVVVTNQYAEATFSSSAGSQIITTAQSLGSSLPNFICSGQGGQINCVDDVYVDFASAVSGISFVAVGDNNVGPNALVRLLNADGLLGSVDIIGDGNGQTPYLVDLAGFSGVTRLEIVRVNDVAGLGFDDFTFTAGGTGGIPEPATWAMMIAGFGLVGAAARRSRPLAA